MQNGTMQLTSKLARRSVIYIGLVSLFINMSNLIVFSYFGVYLKYELCISFAMLGLFEGMIDGFNYFLKFLSGVFCDFHMQKMKKRRHLPLALWASGIALITFCKPFEAIYRTFTPLLITKLFERFGNALQSSPRDYLTTYYCTTNHEKCQQLFSYRVALGAIGCFCGSITSGLLYYLLRDYQKVFWWSLAPAIIAILIVIKVSKNYIALRDNESKSVKNVQSQLTIKERLKKLAKESKLIDRRFYKMLTVSFLYNVFRVSDTFAIIYAFSKQGGEAWTTPFFFAVFHAGAFSSSMTIGKIAHKIKNEKIIFISGLLVFITALQCFIYCSNSALLCYLAMFLLGCYSTISNSIFPAKIIDLVPECLRGTAHGLYNLTSSISIMIGGILCGMFAEAWSQTTAFLFSSVLAGVVMCYFILFVGTKDKKFLYYK